MVFYKFSYKMAQEPYRAHNGEGQGKVATEGSSGRIVVPYGPLSA